MSTERILVVIPCLNEEANIGPLLAELRDHALAMDILVVDDGSRDGTAKQAASYTSCLRHVQTLGIGGARQTGFLYAQRQGYDLCVQMDGDGQHPPDQIPVLLAAWRKNPVNMVIGSRVLGVESFRTTWLRRSANQWVCWLLGRLFRGHQLTDCTSGFRLNDRRAIEFFADHYPLDYPEPISIARALRQGLRVAETPVVMRSRVHGESSIRGLDTFNYMVRVVFYIFVARFRALR